MIENYTIHFLVVNILVHFYAIVRFYLLSG